MDRASAEGVLPPASPGSPNIVINRPARSRRAPPGKRFPPEHTPPPAVQHRCGQMYELCAAALPLATTPGWTSSPRLYVEASLSTAATCDLAMARSDQCMTWPKHSRLTTSPPGDRRGASGQRILHQQRAKPCTTFASSSSRQASPAHAPSAADKKRLHAMAQ